VEEGEFTSTLRLLSLLFAEASEEEIILLVKAVVMFCHKKSIEISRGRPKGESKDVTVPVELYK